MSDLTELRDHARTMTKATHKPEPECLYRSKPWLKAVPRDGCSGCVSDTERELWRAIADELDAYLTPADDGPDLFGEGA